MIKKIAHIFHDFELISHKTCMGFKHFNLLAINHQHTVQYIFYKK